MHDNPPTPANINIMSYADDFPITTTHNDIPTATAQTQSYLNTLQTWFDTNRLKVAPNKSTITLLTNYTKEHRNTPQLTLDNTAIPHKHSTKFVGVTYGTSLSFKDHIHDIKQKCTHRLNTLRTQPVQIRTTHATTCWRTNHLHVASKLQHRHYTQDSSTPSPQHSSSHIHTHFTNIAIQKPGPNTKLGTPPPPPKIHRSEHALPRADQVHLSRLCCGHHTALATYRRRIDDSIDEVSTRCSTNTHSLTHIMTHCPALTHIRAQHNISSPLDLWQSPANYPWLTDRRAGDQQQQLCPVVYGVNR